MLLTKSHYKGSVTSFSILFDFQGPVCSLFVNFAASVSLTAFRFYHAFGLLSRGFLKFFRFSFQKFVLRLLLPFCRLPRRRTAVLWRLSIIPRVAAVCKRFLLFSFALYFLSSFSSCFCLLCQRFCLIFCFFLIFLPSNAVLSDKDLLFAGSKEGSKPF